MILLGYILMHTTFILLFSRSRQLGSNFWLPFAILSSSVLAFLLALPIAMMLRISMDPVALTEALPFLVCTVGFDKPLRLARAVFTHPHLVAPIHGSGGMSSSHNLKPSGTIILECLAAVYRPILRDYGLEIAVLVIGANSKVGGLSEVCALAAVLLGVDCLLLCTFLASIFGIMIEVSGGCPLCFDARDGSCFISRACLDVSRATFIVLQRIGLLEPHWNGAADPLSIYRFAESRLSACPVHAHRPSHLWTITETVRRV